MFSKFDDEARKVLENMKKEMSELHHPYIGSEHLFLSLLKYSNSLNIKKLEKMGITYNSFKDELVKVVGIGSSSNDFYLYTPLLRSIIDGAGINCSENNSDLISSDDLLFAIFEEGEGVAIRILIGMNVDIDKLYDSFCSNSVISSKSSKLSIATFGVDLNEKVNSGEIDPVIGRDEEISRVIEILSRRTKNNPLLIGSAGVGKTAIVEELARLIELKKVPDNLINKRIISVSMASLVAGTKYRGEFEERIGKIIKELEENSDIILFIDEIHTLVGAGGAEGAIDASNILKPALARGKIKVIGATTTEEYKKFIEDDKALSRRFQIVDVKEPDLKVVKDILLKLKPIYENYHKVKISEELIDEIIYLSNKYIYDRKMPDKAIDILDEVCSLVHVSNLNNGEVLDKLNGEILDIKNKKNDSILCNNFDLACKYRKKEMSLESKKNKLELSFNENRYIDVNISDVKLVIEQKSKVPINDNSTFINDFKKLYDKVIGQDTSIEELFKVTKKIKYGYKKNGRPYSFLFVGPSGVGKTLLAKEYAEKFYGNLIRIDMTEYREEHSISKIIGSPPGYVGYNESSNVFEEVKDNPYSVILLDEIDKASPNVINLFLQILDEGKAKNSKGEVVRFDNTIIIMTSNIGFSKGSLGFTNNSSFDKDSLNLFFGIEFLNRINKIIYFNKIDSDSVVKIINSKLKIIKDNYKKDGIDLRFGKKVVDKIKNLCNYEEYGARRIDMVIDSNLENIIVDEIISGNKFININSIDEVLNI